MRRRTTTKFAPVPSSLPGARVGGTYFRGRIKVGLLIRLIHIAYVVYLRLVRAGRAINRRAVCGGLEPSSQQGTYFTSHGA